MSAKTELLALINAANSTTYTEAQLSFGAPVAIEGSDQAKIHNTHVTVSGNSAVGFTGSKVITYKRLFLESVFGAVSPVSSNPAGAGTVQDILNDLATVYGVVIDIEDVVDEAVIYTNGGTYVLKAADTSYKWRGQLTVSLTVDLVDVEPTLAQDTLSGFEEPTLP
jgi:hypothetical protein